VKYKLGKIKLHESAEACYRCEVEAGCSLRSVSDPNDKTTIIIIIIIIIATT